MVTRLTAGTEESIAALSQEKEVPFIGPSALLPQRGLPVNRYVFYLLPGLKEQATTLVDFAARKTDPQKSRVAIICPDAEFSRGIAKSIEDQSKKLGWTTITRIYYPRDRFNPSQYVTELKQQASILCSISVPALRRALYSKMPRQPVVTGSLPPGYTGRKKHY